VRCLQLEGRKGGVEWSEKRASCKQYWLSEQSCKGDYFAYNSIESCSTTIGDASSESMASHTLGKADFEG